MLCLVKTEAPLWSRRCVCPPLAGDGLWYTEMAMENHALSIGKSTKTWETWAMFNDYIGLTEGILDQIKKTDHVFLEILMVQDEYQFERLKPSDWWGYRNTSIPPMGGNSGVVREVRGLSVSVSMVTWEHVDRYGTISWSRWKNPMVNWIILDTW